MSFTDFFADLRRHENHATVIFDRAEPVGLPTDLVMPRRRFLDRFRAKKNSVKAAAATPKQS
ncbi:MAG: hypothetical protein ABI233_07805 [Chthoniobacterales bacterium]